MIATVASADLLLTGFPGGSVIICMFENLHRTVVNYVLTVALCNKPHCIVWNKAVDDTAGSG